MKNKILHIIKSLTFTLIFISPLMGQADEYFFKSKLDQFYVELNNGVATFEGNEVDNEPFNMVKPLFETNLVDPCDGKNGKPDVTITKKSKDKEESRLVYIEKRLVSDGKNCANLTGQGLYSIPLHKNWFINNQNVSIALKNSFSIYKDNALVVEFEKRDGKWRNKDPKFYTNWSFFEKFEQAIKDLPIDYRVHSAAANLSSQFELRQDKRVFKFVKVSEKNWAIRLPNSPWYVASGRLQFLDDMNQTIWISPHAQKIRMAADTTASDANRITAIRSMADQWGPDVKIAYYTILETPGEKSTIIKEVASILRNKPTDDNYSSLVNALAISKDIELQAYLTKILKLRNPKGPAIEDTDDEATVTKKTSEWVRWKKSLKP